MQKALCDVNMCENYTGLILILPLLHCDHIEFLRVTEGKVRHCTQITVLC